jgi:hypothetical protein
MLAVQLSSRASAVVGTVIENAVDKTFVPGVNVFVSLHLSLGDKACIHKGFPSGDLWLNKLPNGTNFCTCCSVITTQKRDRLTDRRSDIGVALRRPLYSLSILRPVITTSQKIDAEVLASSHCSAIVFI